MSTTPEVATGTNSSANDSSIRVYNTLSKQKELFEPLIPGKVGIYLCGPTVYKESHIGHMVGPVIFDTVKRYLVYNGFDVTWVVNITDVDDKLIGESQRRGIPMDAVAEEMIEDYLFNLESLGVTEIDKMPKATEYMTEIISFIEQLIERDYAYASDGDVFFDVTKDEDYGKLSNRSADAQQGEGGEAATKKRSASDFALWKSAKEGEPAWDSPWGPGRPGWHIECSAMSRGLLGESFDIHGGGLDLVFPHHENEIAQSESCHDKPMVKYWLHNGLLRAEAAGKVGGRGEREAEQADASTKVSRSKGDGGLRTLIEQEGGEHLRFFLLRTHYRSTIVFGPKGLAEAKSSLETFHRFFERYERITGDSFYGLKAPSSRVEGDKASAEAGILADAVAHRSQYLAKMDDDFNTGGAVSDLFELVRKLNKFADEHNLENDKSAKSALEPFIESVTILRELSSLLGLFTQAPEAQGFDDQIVGSLVELLIELRAEARGRKDFETGDKIRDRLTDMGITLEDRKEGTLWRME